MAISLGANISSLKAQQELGDATSSVVKSYERLSSGLRINDASDDAAGLAVASQLNAKTRIYATAIRNVNDGISLLSIAQGAVQQLGAITQRQQELAEQAANGSYTSTQRQAINNEANALVKEYNRIVQTTSFNGQSLIDVSQSGGNINIQAGSGNNAVLSLALGTGLATTTTGTSSGSTTTAESLATNGIFQTNTTLLPTTTGTQSTYSGDVNGDGVADIVTQDHFSGEVFTYLGNGDGTYKPPVSFQADSTYAVYGDFNGDGKLDLGALVGVYGGYGFGIQYGNGDGTFQATTTIGFGANFGGSTDPDAEINFNINSLVVGDFDGDGKTDVAVGEYYGYYSRYNHVHVFGATLSVLFGGTSVGQLVGPGNGYAFPKATLSGDLNGDGVSDLLVTDPSYNTTSAFFGSNGGFSASGANFQSDSSGLAVGDFNGDGKADLLDLGGSLSIQLGNGDGNFHSAGTALLPSFTATQTVTGDFNGDGKTDIVAADSSGNAVVLLGNGNGTFKKGATFSIGSNSLTVTNADSDGKSDLILVSGSSVSVLGTEPPQTTSTSTSLTTLISSVDLTSQTSARNTLTTLNDQANRIESELGNIGSYQSRLGIATATLTAAKENFETAASRITDVDIANETSNLTREQILQQSAASVLAQANQEPTLVLKLLSG